MNNFGQLPPIRRRPTATYLKWRRRNDGSLKSSGTAFIRQVFGLWRRSLEMEVDGIQDYVNMLLRSIFFLGHIHDPSLHPTDFFESPELWNKLTRRFPQAFHNYMYPPHRTPFSILLTLAEQATDGTRTAELGTDMQGQTGRDRESQAVRIYGHEDEDEIKDFLLRFLDALTLPPRIKGASNYTHYYTLEATVIAVCYNETSGDLRPVKYYGASLSCRGEREKNFMINWSCLHVWHYYVSYAVLSFRHDEQGNGIRFPVTVKCRAFYRNYQTNRYEDRRPCKNCGDLFSLSNPEMDRNDFPYGNCAETECLSKLIFNDQDVRNNMILGSYTMENLNSLRVKAANALEHGLKA